jgi:hypothetical protein
MWMYSGPEDSDRVSADLPLKVLEKLVHRFTSFSKNNEVPSSCRVVPFSGSHALPEVSKVSPSCSSIFLTATFFLVHFPYTCSCVRQDHQILISLPLFLKVEK